MNGRGFTLPEMLLAMAIGSILLLGAARLLPHLQAASLRLMMQAQLREELLQMVQTLGKTLRRAGYCHGQCGGSPLQIGMQGRCVLVRYDENSNGRWEAPGVADSEFFGFRQRANSLETQRGVGSCEGAGWERLNDPATVGISQLLVERRGAQIHILLRGYAMRHQEMQLTLEQWLTAENL